MAYAFVANRGVQIVGTTAAVAALAATGAGNPLVMFCGWNPNTRNLTGGSDSKGNAWQVGLSKTALNRSCGWIFCNPTTPLALGDVVTPTFSSSITSAVGVLLEFSGGSVQKDATGSASGVSGTDATATVAATAGANIGVMCVGSASATNGNFSPDTGWTRQTGVTHATVNLSMDVYYKINMAAGLITDLLTGTSADWASSAGDLMAALSVMGIGELLPMTGAQ